MIVVRLVKNAEHKYRQERKDKEKVMKVFFFSDEILAFSLQEYHHSWHILRPACVSAGPG